MYQLNKQKIYLEFGIPSKLTIHPNTARDIQTFSVFDQRISHFWLQVHLSCSHSGSASPLTRWFFQGKEATWVNQAGSVYGRSQLKIESVKPEDSGNYTCAIENTELLDSISYNLRVQGKTFVKFN